MSPHLFARRRRDLVAASDANAESWWPWSPSATGTESCPESAVVFDALRRRVTVTGATLRSCCADKMARVLDFGLVIAPGDMSIDLARVGQLEPSVAAAIRACGNRLGARDLRLSIVGASPAVARALEG